MCMLRNGRCSEIMKTAQDILSRAKTQIGKPYIYGYEVDLTDPDPAAFDCSELIQWVCAQESITPVMPDGAIYQMRFCRKLGRLIDVDEAIKTPGALLFRIDEEYGNHVVLSQGNGTTIEARGRRYGVGTWSTRGRLWTQAALIPGVAYGD
jgi:cell wall-associated NlpC family hydrolase